MLFNSYTFLYVFLPIALVGYYGAAYLFGARAARIWLCLASFVFYGWWNPALVLLLVGSIVFNHSLSLLLVGDGSSSSLPQGKVLLAGVAANLLLLVYYKYLFPLFAFLHALGWTAADCGSIILPLGISFFTFTQIGYLVDCRQGLVRDRSLLNYILFVTFFPHLIAGPILHHREIMPQFANDATYRWRVENIAIGMTLFTFGLVKKVMLADSIAPWAELGFANLQHITLVRAWSVALAYSMQLYFDFSGYSDMAVGLGIMFAIRLPMNFNSPYRSMSIIDFWQRWHMTLTRYLTLLVYNPLALWVTRHRQRAGFTMNRQAIAAPWGFASLIMFPTLITTLLAGIWHGAGLQFIVYGALHGVYLSVNHAWRIFFKPFAASASLRAAVLYSIVWRVLLTYGAVLSAEIVFRASSVTDAAVLMRGMLGLHGSEFPLPIAPDMFHYFGALRDWLLNHRILVIDRGEAYDAITSPLVFHSVLVLLLGAVAFGFPNVYQILGDRSPALTRVKATNWKSVVWQPTWAYAAGIGALLAVASLLFQRTAQFLYFQF
jgi:alginate O-acetyltransferase complex protein AlgI